MQQSAPKCSQYTGHILLKGVSKWNLKLCSVNGMHINFHDSAPIHHHRDTLGQCACLFVYTVLLFECNGFIFNS
jgi:hypothetical protein